MFIIELTYKADLAEIDAHMGAHVIFLKKYYASGNFLVSGRKIPRDGGIILAVATSRRQIEAIVEEEQATGDTGAAPKIRSKLPAQILLIASASVPSSSSAVRCAP